jgi:hypothetical protein
LSQRKIAKLSADALWQEWRADIERIALDAYELFAIRRQFREIGTMFEQNPELQEAGSSLWGWLITLYAAAVLMRLRREADTQANTINLRTLLDEIEKRPDVITRGRIAARNPNIPPFLARSIDEAFSQHWAQASASGGADDQIDAAVVRTDRVAFQQATRQLDEITSRTLAHRNRDAPDDAVVSGLDGIFLLFEELLTKYLGLLTGSLLMAAEPVPQFNTAAPFMFPWHPRAYAKWKRLEVATQRALSSKAPIDRTGIEFDAVARALVEMTDPQLIREQLRLVWNARGAADIAKVESELAGMMGPSASGPHIENLDRALRTLDRQGNGGT